MAAFDADALRAVVSFSAAGAAHARAGRHARAASAYASALSAAAALSLQSESDDPSSAASKEDCLVVAFLRLLRAQALGEASCASRAPPDGHASRALAALVLAAVDATQRRAAARTLQRPAPHEAAWYAAHCAAAEAAAAAEEVNLSHTAGSRHRGGSSGACARGRAGALVGYDALLTAAALTLRLEREGGPHSLLSDVPRLLAFIDTASRLMAAPRPSISVPIATAAEGVFFGQLEGYCADATRALADRPVGEVPRVLLGAWARLRRSGVLHARGIVIGGDDNSSSGARGVLLTAGMQHVRGRGGGDATTTLVLRCCAREGCDARELLPASFKLCAACKSVCYCSREHQAHAWGAHRDACKAARVTMRAAQQATRAAAVAAATAEQR
jgi:hypothetical protein